MAKQKEDKTNAMRILESLHIPFTALHYVCEDFVDGIQIADLLGLSYRTCFKTLLTKAANGGYFFFVLPVDKELDLKKAAKAAGVKSVAMVPVKDIFALTGYIRGGCTSIGAKKAYPTFLADCAMQEKQIIVSGGKLGTQLQLTPTDYCTAAKATPADILLE